ncbi:hypothetical protein KO506_03535 [Polaribacter vadi]|nr:hypothetical protein [Polaribacter vadi]MDO6740268.1 hypothetical protein [Polaribacter sp. 1_MG-2023]
MIKKFYSFLLMFIFLFGCASGNMKLEDKPLVEIKEAYFSKYSSGIKGGGAGFNVHISISDKLEQDKKLSGVYFKEKYANLKFNEPNIYTAFIRTKKSEETNLDAINSSIKDEKTKEVLKDDFPFQLKSNEAVLVYMIKEKKKYFKVLLEKKDIGIPQ